MASGPIGWHNTNVRELTLAEFEGSSAQAASVSTFHMDEQAFRAFYDKTRRPLRSYLGRIAGQSLAIDDLVQESYYRFLRADLRSDDESYHKNYLFRIATNLARDQWRRRPRNEVLSSYGDAQADDVMAERSAQRADVRLALEQLKPREREILWLAYVEGFSHKEIAGIIGLRAGSIRLLLFRARRKLASVIHNMSEMGPSRSK